MGDVLAVTGGDTSDLDAADGHEIDLPVERKGALPRAVNGMVRPCSCPASDRSWQGAPKTRSTPCLKHSKPRSPQSASISATTRSTLLAWISAARLCCVRSGRVARWKHDLPTCRRA